ncbi:hypothetical protein A1O1_07759 [Capronia coronata CBS 617.96]|uniref:Uncharacterized protein n=1 Tax=Capronia coronata CBS 617.96 TaxID=1182541 RepID=W9YHD7_9EURO|nr:uncharacterized protein A1O1_07759 [Capronia coronata CBS 617.96]EXJ81694.1 hypothetical protein A1O1_07759 [Capronia coronata CBS 617.96]
MGRPILTFIDAAPVEKAQALEVRRQVRSHAAKAASLKDVSAADDGLSSSSNANAAGKKKRRRKYPSWTVQIGRGEQQAAGLSLESSRSLLTSLSGTGMIPASRSAVYHQPFVSAVLHNYLQHLAVAIPEIDGEGEGQTALLRTRWFPMVLNSPIVFQVIVLFSASHYASQRQDMAFPETILSLKQYALRGIAESLSSASQGMVVRDELIAATAKMASYEAVFGDEDAYHSHMKGVEDMLRVRGGLDALGLGGFLARLLIFIDTNSAFLLNTHLHLTDSSFPRLEPFLLPNPSRFVGEV